MWHYWEFCVWELCVLMALRVGGQGGHDRVMAVIALDREAVRAAVDEVAGRVMALVRDSPIDRRLPGQEWTIADAAAHLVVVFFGFTAALTGQAGRLAEGIEQNQEFRVRLAENNQRTLGMVDRTDAAGMAGRIAAGARGFLDALAGVDPAAQYQTPWYGHGVTRSADTLTALALGELTVHGLDMARAAGREWLIPPQHARLIVGTVFPEMFAFVVKGEAAARTRVVFEVRVRGGGPRFVVRIGDGTAIAEPATPNAAVDCVLSVAPVEFLLMGYGRLPQWRALLRGAVFSWGRRPWAGLRFLEFFANP